MASKLVLSLVILSSVVFAQTTYETYNAPIVEEFDDISLMRIPEEIYVTLPISNPSGAMNDFSFMTSYADEQLSQYFEGGNYVHAPVERTSPLFITMDIFNMGAERHAFYLVPLATKENPPAAHYPMYLDDIPEKFYFIRKIDTSDFKSILHAAADMMADLSIDNMPFDGSKITLALYDFPSDGNSRPNEIWIQRSLKEEGYLTS